MLTFNRNMGCIEIMQELVDAGRAFSLIETWDVLKYDDVAAWYNSLFPFNRNMGCIEIVYLLKCQNLICLIETWDVLK